MTTHAFTCTGPFAILIMLGIKRVENRAALPSPREGRCAVSCSKSLIIVAHNHPSGSLVASPQDRELTAQLVSLGNLLGIPLRDHLILGAGDTFVRASRKSATATATRIPTGPTAPASF